MAGHHSVKMLILVFEMFLQVLPLDNLLTPSNGVCACYQFTRAICCEVLGDVSPHQSSSATPTGAGEGHLWTSCEVCRGDFLVCVLVEAVRAIVLSVGARATPVLFQLPPFNLQATSTVGACNNDIATVCLLVCFGVYQITLPLAASPSVGALHLEVVHSSLIEVIRGCGEAVTIYRTSCSPCDAPTTEQVSTTGLNWGRDQLQTDGTLQLLQQLLWSVQKLILYSLEATGGHVGAG